MIEATRPTCAALVLIAGSLLMPSERAATGASPLQAQEPEPGQESKADQGKRSAFEAEVTVTARTREERQIDVPLSISTASEPDVGPWAETLPTIQR